MGGMLLRIFTLSFVEPRPREGGEKGEVPGIGDIHTVLFAVTFLATFTVYKGVKESEVCHCLHIT